MRLLLALLLSIGTLQGIAQVDSTGLKQAIQKIDQALLQKNESDLKSLLHPAIQFGHSNGWVQSRENIFSDFKNGKLHYDKINSSQVNILEISKKRAIIKMNIDASGRVNESEFDLSLHVMQVWLKTKKGWQLFARQSARL